MHFVNALLKYVSCAVMPCAKGMTFRVGLCAAIEWIKPLFLEGGQFLNQDGKQVALLGQVYSGEQLDYLPAMMGQAEVVVINDLDWQVYTLPSSSLLLQQQKLHTKLLSALPHIRVTDDVNLTCERAQLFRLRVLKLLVFDLTLMI